MAEGANVHGVLAHCCSRKKQQGRIRSLCSIGSSNIGTDHAWLGQARPGSANSVTMHHVIPHIWMLIYHTTCLAGKQQSLMLAVWKHGGHAPACMQLAGCLCWNSNQRVAKNNLRVICSCSLHVAGHHHNDA